MMTFEDFKTRVDLYSADLSRWPTDQVKPALAFMKEVPAAQGYFDAALALDDKLRTYVPSQGSPLPALEERIMRNVAALPKQPAAQANPAAKAALSAAAKSAPEKALFRFSATWIAAPGGGLLAAAVLGFILGFSPAQQKETLLDPVYAQQAQIIHSDGITDGGMF